MSKKFNKIMSVVLALMMVCSLLPMSAMAAENADYTVTFEPGENCVYTGEGGYPTAVYTEGEAFLLPDPATLGFRSDPENLAFQGWSVKDDESNTMYDIGYDVSRIIDGDVTFLANYIEQTTVTYIISAGTIKTEDTNPDITRGPIPSQYVGEITLPTTDDGIEYEFGWTIPSGIEFDHWTYNNGTAIPEGTDPETGELTGRTISFEPHDGETYTAIWSGETAETVTVTLYPGKADGVAVPGEPVSGGEFTKGSEYYGPSENPFAMVGYHSIGWNTDEDATEGLPMPIVLNEDTNLYVIWEKDEPAREYWQITIYPGEGATFRDDVTGYQTVNGNLVATVLRNVEYNVDLPNVTDERIVVDEEGETIRYNAVFETMPEGKEFAGWLGSDGTVYHNGEVLTANSDMTFTATWRDEGTGPYTIGFEAGTLSSDDNRMVYKTYAVGSTVTLPASAAAVREDLGWTIPEDAVLLGWVNANDTSVYLSNTFAIATDMTIVAMWDYGTATQFTISFDAGGGTGEMEPVVVYTERTSYPYVLPSNEFTAPAGMEFAYWTVSGFEGTYQPRDVVNISSDVTVTAHWRPITYYYMVSFDANGGSGEMAPDVIESTTPTATYILPECTFTAPEGMEFVYWTIDDGEVDYYPGDPIDVSASITLVANWDFSAQADFFA